jgi:hypothetical protein
MKQRIEKVVNEHGSAVVSRNRVFSQAGWDTRREQGRVLAKLRHGTKPCEVIETERPTRNWPWSRWT